MYTHRHIHTTHTHVHVGNQVVMDFVCFSTKKEDRFSGTFCFG